MFLQYKFLPLEKFDVHIILSTVIRCCCNLSSLHTFTAINLIFHSVCVFSFPSLLIYRIALLCVSSERCSDKHWLKWMWVLVGTSESSLIHITPSKPSEMKCVLTRIRTAVVFCRSLEGLMLLYMPPCSDI